MTQHMKLTNHEFTFFSEQRTKVFITCGILFLSKLFLDA
jgi:hypothetical protein